MQVGTKELKNRLSRYLRRVRAGEVVHVTDRGKVVAELRPVPKGVTDDTACLLALEAEGTVTIGTGQPLDFAPTRIPSKRRASAIIIEDRQ
jgi:prevent-host-death family protein